MNWVTRFVVTRLNRARSEGWYEGYLDGYEQGQIDAGVTARERLDFISIDTEGTEDAVLRGSNVQRWRPRVICVENWPGVNKSDHLLLPLGYTRVERVMGNYTDWYIL
jgi:hypothetical protein